MRPKSSASWLKQSKNQTIIVYCHQQNCWLSYNLALRLINLGYRNVHWMRDGIEGWLDEELPLAFLQQITK
jgi:rhodanese-related sulfurtransferase